MKQFKIKVISKKPKKVYGLFSYRGKITIGNFSEKFVMPINDWSLNKYKQQWEEGFERLKTHESSCFVTTVQNFTTDPLIEIWAAYKDKNEKKLFFHNILLTKETMENDPFKLSEFNLETCYQFINSRFVNEKGEAATEIDNRVSEWSIDLEEKS